MAETDEEWTEDFRERWRSVGDAQYPDVCGLRNAARTDVCILPLDHTQPHGWERFTLPKALLALQEGTFYEDHDRALEYLTIIRESVTALEQLLLCIDHADQNHGGKLMDHEGEVANARRLLGQEEGV